MVYEQSYLTWERGLQNTGFSLAHQALGFFILGVLSSGLTHVWLLVVAALVVASKRFRPLTTFQSAVIAATVLTVAMDYIPYLWWQRLVVQIPGSRVSRSDIFLEAAGEGRLGTAKTYFPPNADLKSINKAFFGTCVEGQIEMMNFLMENGADVNCLGDELNETPLMAAAQMGHLEALKILLAKGANPNLKDTQGDTALSLALEYHHPEIAAILRQRGAKANILDAASAGDVEAIQALLKADAQTVNAKDYLGYSPLYHAAEAGHAGVAAVLLAAGANVNDFSGNNGFGDSPLLIAAHEGRDNVVELLLEHGADVNSKNQRGETALEAAARYDHLIVAEELIAHGADVNIKGSLMCTPLDEAAYSGSKAIAELLIAHKADVTVRDQYGFTPLHMAAYHGHPDVVEVLLAAGSDINVRDNDGKTPLWQAKSRGQNNTANLLRQHGAKE